METSTCLIPLSQGQSARVSPEDFEFLSKFRWYAVRRTERLWYAATYAAINGKRINTRMHQVVARLMGLPPAPRYDHKNHDGLDNSRGNIRMCTGSQNSANGRKAKGRSSLFKGVSWKESEQKWLARITVNYKTIFLGYYTDEIEAAAVYAAFAIFYHGEFACFD